MNIADISTVIQDWLEKVGGLKPLSFLILIGYGFNLAIPKELVPLAASHLLVVFLLDVIAQHKVAGPMLDPNTKCNNCGEKKLKLLSSVVVCTKCNHRYTSKPTGLKTS